MTLYKITHGECGEATINSAYEKEAEEFAGLSEGSCKDQGFTVLDGTKEMQVPFIGDVKVSLYSQASEVEKYVNVFGHNDPVDRYRRKLLSTIRRSIRDNVHALTHMI